jgi:hypothetical protein
VDLWALTRRQFRTRAGLADWLKVNLAAFILILPWLPAALAQFSAQHGKEATLPTSLETVRHMLTVSLHFFISPPSLLTVPAVVIAALVVLGLARPAFPGFRALFGLTALFCLLLPAVLARTGVLHIWQLFQVKYFIAAAPVLFLALVQGIAAIRPKWLRPGAMVLVLGLVLMNFISFCRADYLFRSSAVLAPNSDARKVIHFLDRMPAKLMIVTDRTNGASLMEIAGESPPGRSIIIGDCRVFEDRLSGSLKAPLPPALVYLHFKPTPGRQYDDCTSRIQSALSGSYSMASLALDAHWMIRFFERTRDRNSPVANPGPAVTR